MSNIKDECEICKKSMFPSDTDFMICTDCGKKEEKEIKQNERY